MLKETEKHRRFCHIFIIGVILIGGGPGPLAPFGYAYVWALGPGTVSYGKSGVGYCITLIKKWDEDLR